jgi:perosamine synthetase
MPRFVPPAGSPLPLKHILRAARAVFSAREEPKEYLELLAARFQVRHIFPVSSGRCALWLILRSLRRLEPDRDVVAFPAYTCFSVPAAMVRAGLRLHPVEVDPQTLDFDFAQLEAVPSHRLLCVVTANLFGLVGDAPRIREIARDKDAFVIDDAAQGLGASRDGCFAGTLGDVGFFSLARGKAIAGVGGGLVVTNSDAIGSAIREELNALAPASFAENVRLLLAMSAYSVFLRPRMYPIPSSLPFLKLGLTEFEPDFATGQLAPVAQALISQGVKDLDRLNEARLKRASQIRRALENASDFTLPEPTADCRPTYIRFPLIARDENTRSLALAQLRDAGIGASAMYPSAICDIPGIECHMATGDFHRPQAEDLSRRLLTLPTHPYVLDSDVEKMADILLAKSPEPAASSQPESSSRSGAAIRLDSVR